MFALSESSHARRHETSSPRINNSAHNLAIVSIINCLHTRKGIPVSVMVKGAAYNYVVSKEVHVHVVVTVHTVLPYDIFHNTTIFVTLQAF